ncbi:hypothetical protein PCCS19_39970 [Paenibacillus sp. CCS19]|uniref:S8 family serine peptidase n=1 Tax=Paenibacillus sp. CCS19 TaxID=3158387 RepID=UPI002565A188|nr:S8 family serine peptidase [Paenibacillus cellulosilyticus]GMK40941.1 hypothetical protein PCCS19_39970 [Paenibacillus cellulosilyticus]
MQILRKVIAGLCIAAMLCGYLPNESFAENTGSTQVEGDTSITTDSSPNKVIIKLKKNDAANNFTTRHKDKAKKLKKFKKDMFEADLTDDELAQVRLDPGVEYVEVNANVSVTNVEGTELPVESVTVGGNQDDYPWGLRAIGSDYLTSLQTGETVKVAVMDTGISNHPELKIAGGVSFVDGTSYSDDNGHGTHVAGTIAAQKDNIGVVGVSPNVELYSVKVLDRTGTGSYSNVIKGIDWAIENNIDIVSMSFGGQVFSQALHESISAAEQAGIIVVAAAGNQGSSEEGVLYPAKFDETVAVGAINKQYTRASFSGIGSELDIVAPGVDVLSTTFDGKYAEMSGTSMAVPHVTGALAVLISNNLNPNEAVDRLLSTATSLGSEEEYGKGLVNVPRALGLVNEPLPLVIDDKEDQPIDYELPEVERPASSTESSIKKLTELSKYIVSLKDMILEKGDITSAKLIEQEYNSLLNIHNELSQLPDQIAQFDKSDHAALASMVNQNYEDKEQEYIKLESQYMQLAVKAREILKVKVGADSELISQSYNKYGDNQTILPGNDALVYLFLDTPKSEINITVYPLDNPNNIVASETYTDASADTFLHYFWQTTSNILPGTYIIHWHYPEAPEWDDYFTVNVVTTSSIETLDLNSPIDKSLPAGTSQTFKFTPSSTAVYRLYTSPYGGTVSYNDTVLELYSDPDLTDLLSSNDDFNGTTFSEIKATLTEGVTYYILLKHYNSNGEIYTRINVALDTPAYPNITLDVPEDINKSAGQSSVYSFTPSKTGMYRFFTGYYGGNSGSGSSDTVLYLYSDIDLMNQIGYSDDSNGTRFSDFYVWLQTGVEYHVKLIGYNNSAVKARLTVTTLFTQYLTQTEDSSVDVSLPDGTFEVYRLAPSKSGQYLVYTSPYGGEEIKINDTRLSIYSDEALTNRIAYDDDSNGNLYSRISVSLEAGVDYYLKVSPYNSSSSFKARLSFYYGDGFTPVTNRENYEISNDNYLGKISYYKFTTPTEVGAGNYRFYTSPYQGIGPNNDTVIDIYSDADLTTLIASNDDVSENPYGSNFSKVELSLASNTTYYIKVKSRDTFGSVHARFTVEDDFDSTPALASPATWEQIYSQELSSRFDIDYFKVDVTEPTSVHLNVTVNTITLMDSNSNVIGIFTPDNVDSFDITAGTYYAKVAFNEDYASNLLTASDATTTSAVSYEISHKQATVSYSSDGIALQTVNAYIDPSKPSLTDYATITWSYSNDHYKTLIQVIDQQNYVIYEEERGLLEGSCTPYGAPAYVKITPCKHSFEWSGRVNRNVSRAIPVLDVYNGDLEYYYAKNGRYTVKIAPMPPDKYSRHASVQTVTVINQATTLDGIIPAPPTKMQKKTKLVDVTAGNKDECVECYNYFSKYIWDKASPRGPENQYDEWSESIYGLNGIERFWKSAELFVYDDSKSVITNVQNLSSIAGIFVPIFDAANSVVYMMKGEYVNASISAISAIPFVGEGIAAGSKIAGVKLVRRIHNLEACINCFTAGTKVTTPAGEVSIENIKVGDLVLSKDPVTEATAYKSVEQLFQKEIEDSWKITAGGEIITTTSEHPFWILNKGWVLTKDLVVGDQFETYDGSKVFVENIENVQEHNVVYNFAVQDFHTYYVTNLKILAHNTACLTAADYIAKNVSQYTSRQTTVTSGNILAKELEKVDIHAPSIPGIDKWDAHHIVPQNINNNPNIELAQKILKEHDIDINSAANGVWLPKRKGESAIDIDGTMVATHNGYHIYDYFKYVADKLNAVRYNRDDVLDVIESIREELLTGQKRLANLTDKTEFYP